MNWLVPVTPWVDAFLCTQPLLVKRELLLVTVDRSVVDTICDYFTFILRPLLSVKSSHWLIHLLYIFFLLRTAKLRPAVLMVASLATTSHAFVLLGFIEPASHVVLILPSVQQVLVLSVLDDLGLDVALLVVCWRFIPHFSIDGSSFFS